MYADRTQENRIDFQHNGSGAKIAQMRVQCGVIDRSSQAKKNEHYQDIASDDFARRNISRETAFAEQSGPALIQRAKSKSTNVKKEEKHSHRTPKSNHRPTWTTETKKRRIIEPGSGNHRRHIIPQSTLLDVLNTYKVKTNGDLTVLESELGVEGGGIDGCHKVLFNNPNNLFVGDGGENTAIGFLSHKVGSLLEYVRNNADAAEGMLNEYVHNGLISALESGFSFTSKHRADLLIFFNDCYNNECGSKKKRSNSDIAKDLEDIQTSLNIDLPKITNKQTNHNALKLYRYLKCVLPKSPAEDTVSWIKQFMRMGE